MGEDRRTPFGKYMHLWEVMHLSFLIPFFLSPITMSVELVKVGTRSSCPHKDLWTKIYFEPL